jgi:hypothetical protein
MHTRIQYHLCLLLAMPFLLNAQYKSTGFLARDGYSMYGLKAGATLSGISNLQTTILSEPYFLNYTLNAQKRYGWTAGIFYNYRFQNPFISIETDLGYAQEGSDIVFNNLEKDFNYRMQFKYQYINLAGILKFYPWGDRFDNEMATERNGIAGFYVGAGPQAGFNVAAQNIVYTSGGKGRLAAFGSDLDQQQQLRNVLKGKTNFGFSFGLGYEFSALKLSVDAKYFLGLTDVTGTQSNQYNFIENKNTSSCFMLVLGWDFSSFVK